MFSAQSLATYLEQWGMLAIFVSLGISIVIAIAGVIPSIFVTGANILLFGPINGLLLSWTGEILGAALSFSLYRAGFKKKTEKFSERHRLLAKITKSKGLRTGILIFQGRLLPLIPSGFVTLAAAISNVSLSTFLIATSLGKLPSIAIEALVSYDFINLHQNWLRLSITVAAILLIIPILKIKDKN